MHSHRAGEELETPYGILLGITVDQRMPSVSTSRIISGNPREMTDSKICRPACDLVILDQHCIVGWHYLSKFKTETRAIQAQ